MVFMECVVNFWASSLGMPSSTKISLMMIVIVSEVIVVRGTMTQPGPHAGISVASLVACLWYCRRKSDHLVAHPWSTNPHEWATIGMGFFFRPRTLLVLVMPPVVSMNP